MGAIEPLICLSLIAATCHQVASNARRMRAIGFKSLHDLAMLLFTAPSTNGPMLKQPAFEHHDLPVARHPVIGQPAFRLCQAFMKFKGSVGEDLGFGGVSLLMTQGRL